MTGTCRPLAKKLVNDSFVIHLLSVFGLLNSSAKIQKSNYPNKCSQLKINKSKEIILFKSKNPNDIHQVQSLMCFPFQHKSKSLNDDGIDGNHSRKVLQLYLVLAFAQFL